MRTCSYVSKKENELNSDFFHILYSIDGDENEQTRDKTKNQKIPS